MYDSWVRSAMPRSTSASSMRCLSNVIAVSSIDAQAHACVDQGTTLMSNRARLELHHRVSGLVQRAWSVAFVPLTFDMSGGRRQAKPAGGRPLDRGVRPRAAANRESLSYQSC